MEALSDLFPQVDARILRAAHLSHKDDVSAAIDWILTEVIPEMAPEGKLRVLMGFCCS